MEDLSLNDPKVQRCVITYPMWADLPVDSEVRQALEFMEIGSNLVKVRSKRDQNLRYFTIDSDGIVLSYAGPKSTFGLRAPDQRRVYMSSIKEIREGRLSDIFEQSFRGNKTPPHTFCCFTLVIGDKSETLDLVAPDVESQKRWVIGLNYLLAKFATDGLAEKQKIFIKEVFHKADVDGDGSLNLKEIMLLLQTLNISIDVDHAAFLFKCADTNSTKNEKGDNCLDVNEFTQFIQLVTKRQELDEIFKRYDRGTSFLDAGDLEIFFRKEQCQDVSSNDVMRIIESCESCPNVRQQKLLSISGFYTLCASPWMDIKSERCLAVHQDMDQPLSHYFIDSSHNTYLARDQLIGSSKVESYIHVLKKGCRCIELDVWDGERDEPVIHHGYTFTSKISLKDVLEAINQYAFLTSEYPVIMCIENHLSLEQQKKMAFYFKTIFNTKLLPPYPRGMSCLPSPDQLKNTIVIEGKKIPDEFYSEAESQGSVEVEEYLPEANISVLSDVKKSPERTKHMLAKEWSDLVVISQCDAFKNFDSSREKTTFRDLLNLKESKALSLAKGQGSEFVFHNSWQLTRIYPNGDRMGSSNYHPVHMWVAGCQIASLNYQTGDEPMFVNKGLFEENGNCGYVLKPQFMRPTDSLPLYNPQGPFPPHWRRTLKLQIISGYQLPKKSRDKVADILDPYVKVNIVGVSADCKEFKTDVIQNNGFHPVWNKELIVHISCPEMALVLFQICENRRNAVAAQYCLPFNAMREGFRTVPLKTLYGEATWAASLLVHVSIITESRSL